MTKEEIELARDKSMKLRAEVGKITRMAERCLDLIVLMDKGFC